MRSLVAARPEVKGAAVCVIIGDDLQYALAVERAALRILECSRVVIRSEGMQTSGHLQVAKFTGLTDTNAVVCASINLRP